MHDESTVIDDNRVVALHYNLNNGFGEIIDTSQGQLPLVYMHNTNALLPSLERELTGHLAGDQFDVVIYPEDGYGYSDESLIQTMGRASFDEIRELQVGMRIRMLGQNEESQLVTVREIRDDEVVVDGNHPLAGQVLHFQIAIVTVREPTERELAEGHAESVNGQANSP